MTITPEQARALLDGATPGPWEALFDNESIETDASTVLCNTDGAVEWGRNTEHDVPLAAAAPAMAEQIAGMQWEHGVEQHTLDNPHWHTAIPYDRGFDEDQCTQLAETFRANNPHNKYRIVRRLVSAPEVVE